MWPYSLPPACLGSTTYFQRNFPLRQIKNIKKGSLLGSAESKSALPSRLPFLIILIFPQENSLQMNFNLCEWEISKTARVEVLQLILRKQYFLLDNAHKKNYLVFKFNRRYTPIIEYWISWLTQQRSPFKPGLRMYNILLISSFLMIPVLKIFLKIQK